MKISTGLTLVGWLTLAPVVAMAAEFVVEPCVDPMNVLHLRSDGLPLRDEQTLCTAEGEFPPFVALNYGLRPEALKARFTLTEEGATLTLTVPDQAPLTVALAPNQPEQIAGEYPAGKALWVRLERKRWPNDPARSELTVTAVNVPVRTLMERVAQVLNLRLEGVEHLCDEPVTFQFALGIPFGSMLSLAAHECGARWHRAHAGVIQLEPASNLPWPDPPALPQDELLAEVDAALAQAASPKAQAAVLADAGSRLAAIDPDRIGPAWVQLALLEAHSAPVAERADAFGRAIDLHARLLPTRNDQRAEYDHRAGALHAERADVLMSQGRRAEALAELELALGILAFEPETLRRAVALVDESERSTWWRRQIERVDAARRAWFDGDAAEHAQIDEDRYRAIRSWAAHAIASDAVLAGRLKAAGDAWMEVAIARAIDLGGEHRRARDAHLEATLLLQLSLDPPARYPEDSPIVDPPLAAGRQPLAATATETERADELDLFDEALAQRLSQRLEAATDADERAHLAVLVAEGGLLRNGKSALDAGLDHYRLAAELCRAVSCREGSFTRELLVRRIEYLKGLSDESN